MIIFGWIVLVIVSLYMTFAGCASLMLSLAYKNDKGVKAVTIVLYAVAGFLWYIAFTQCPFSIVMR